MSRYQDTREPGARLVDGDRVLMPGQDKTLTELIAKGRKVRVPLRGDRR